MPVASVDPRLSDEKLRVIARPGETSFVLQRTFHAPARLVYLAMSTPELVARWWGPRGTTLVTCEMDFRVGGAWRFVLHGPGGTDVGFRGEYQEIVPGERIVQTFIYDPYPTAVAVETMRLEERDGRTTLTTKVQHASVENRDGHLSSGMEQGAGETMDRLAEVVGELAYKS